MFESFVNLPINIVFKEYYSIIKEKLIRNINGGYYKFHKNICLCGNLDSNNDIILSYYDYIGIPLTTLICKICGLIRTQNHLDTKSLINFYKNYYNVLYYNTDNIDNNDFENEISYNSRSNKLFQLINSNGLLNKIHNIFEIGCNAGWNLYPYHIRNKYVSGCDLSGDRILLGVSKGMNLYEGDINNNLTKYKSQDLVILSHVLEHVTKPIEFLIEVIYLIKGNKYLLIEIPSVLSIKDSVLITTFHFPHVYTFNENFLLYFFKALKLEILYHNKECVFILKKPNTWSPPPIQEVEHKLHSGKLTSDFDNIIFHLKKFYIKAKFRFIVIRILEIFFIKEPLKLFLNIFK